MRLFLHKEIKISSNPVEKSRIFTLFYANFMIFYAFFAKSLIFRAFFDDYHIRVLTAD